MSRLFSILFLLALLLSACAPTATPASIQVATEAPVTINAPEPTQVPPAAASSSALFQIVKVDGTKFDVTLDALKKLPLAQLTVDNKVQEARN